MKKSYSVVQIGYNLLVFSSHEEAIELYRLIGKSIPADKHHGKLPDGREGITLIREDSVSISLEQVAANKCELQYTLADLKEAAEARADVEGEATVINTPVEIEYQATDAASTVEEIF